MSQAEEAILWKDCDIISFVYIYWLIHGGNTRVVITSKIFIIIITSFQEDNIFGMNASLTYGPQLQRLTCH